MELADTEYTFVLGSVAADGQLDALVDVLVAEAEATEESPGLIGYEILRPLDPAQPVLLVSTWESEDAFEDFMETAEGGPDTSGLVAGSTNTVYETVVSYSVEELVDDDVDDDDDGEDEYDVDDDYDDDDDPGDDYEDEADADYEDERDLPLGDEDELRSGQSSGDGASSAERMFAVDLFNATWDLLESESRTAEDDRTMLGAALASRFHWRHVGEPKNFSISDWQVSRVFAELGDVVRAREYAGSALEIATEYGLGPFYVGYAEEALARAAALAGDDGEREHWMSRARASLDDIEDAETKALLAADLDEIDRWGTAAD